MGSRAGADPRHRQLLSKMGLCNDQRKSGCYVFHGLLISAVALAMVIIGVIHIKKDWDPEQTQQEIREDVAKNACETLVPAWHIVGGFMILTLLVLRIILAKCCDGCGSCCDSKGGQVGGAVCKLGATLIYDLVYLGLIAGKDCSVSLSHACRSVALGGHCVDPS